MSLNRLAYHTPRSRHVYRTSIRMASTIVGQSGRVYVQGEVLQRNRKDHKLSIFKTQYVHFSFVLKHVSSQDFDFSSRLASEFAGSECTLTANKTKAFLFIPISEVPYLA